MQTTPRIGEAGQMVNGGVARPGLIESIAVDGTVKVVRFDVTGSGGTLAAVVTPYESVEFVAVGGTPPATGAYFQQVDYSA
jgi:hypothetical protein